jgi:hypothetical protein
VIAGTRGHVYMVPAGRCPKMEFRWKDWEGIGDAGAGLGPDSRPGQVFKGEGNPKKGPDGLTVWHVILWFDDLRNPLFPPSIYVNRDILAADILGAVAGNCTISFPCLSIKPLSHVTSLVDLLHYHIYSAKRKYPYCRVHSQPSQFKRWSASMEPDSSP